MLLVLAFLGAGCATPESYYCQPPDKATAVAEFLLLGLAAGAELSQPRYAEFPPPSPPRRTTPPFYGTVSLASGERIPGAAVTLRGTNDFVVLQATTDERGRFLFPMPLPADWYTLTVDDDRAAGKARLWLHKRHSDVEVVVEAKAVATD